MTGNRYKAAWLLAAAAAGLLISFPSRMYFWGGLWVSVCQAALVGGLADWFAVTALFRKPLGIGFRTAVIPRNRERIFQALVQMVEGELLAKENIARRLSNYDFAAQLLLFFDKHAGPSSLRQFLAQLAQPWFLQLQSGRTAATAAKALVQYFQHVSLAPLLIQSGRWLVAHKYDGVIFGFVIDRLEEFVKERQTKEMLTEFMLHVRRAYEGSSERRRIFNQLLNFSEQQLAEAAQSALLAFLSELKSTQHPLRSQLQRKFAAIVEQLAADSVLQQRVEQWKNSWLEDNVHRIARTLAKFIDKWRRISYQDGTQPPLWQDELTALITGSLEQFAGNEMQRQAFNRQARTWMEGWLDGHHDEIGKLVYSSLNTMSNDVLVSFIEEKAGNDLQMIRINGSVVGALVGMIIYLLTFWW